MTEYWFFLGRIFSLWYHLHWPLYQEYLNIRILNNLIVLKYCSLLRIYWIEENIYIYIYIYIYIMCRLGKYVDYVHIEYRPMSTIVREFANGLGDLGSIPGLVIPYTEKMALDASLLNTQHYKVRIKGKWSNPGKGVAPSPTPRYRDYWKGSLRVTLD